MKQGSQEFPKQEEVDESTKGWVEIASEAGLGKIDVNVLVSKMEAKLEAEGEDSPWSKRMNQLAGQRMSLKDSKAKIESSKAIAEMLKQGGLL